MTKRGGSMETTEQLLIRACKSSNPEAIVRRVYRRFYLSQEIRACDLAQILMKICERYRLWTASKLLSNWPRKVTLSMVVVAQVESNTHVYHSYQCSCSSLAGQDYTWVNFQCKGIGIQFKHNSNKYVAIIGRSLSNQKRNICVA